MARELSDLFNVFANSAISGVESAVGQNFYQPKVYGEGAQKLNQGFDKGAEISGQVAPAFMGPYGAAVQGARQIAPDMTPESQQAQEFNMGGMFSNLGGEQSGPSVNKFNGPSHEEGGFMINPNAELEKNETTYNNGKEGYAFSPNGIVPGTEKKKKGKGITFAEQSKKYDFKDTDDDISKNTKKMLLEKLKGQNEEYRQGEFAKEQKKLEKKQAKLQEQFPDKFPGGGVYGQVDPNQQSVMFGGQGQQGNTNFGGSAMYSPNFQQVNANLGYQVTPSLNANAGASYNYDQHSGQGSFNPNVGVNYQKGNFGANANYNFGQQYPTFGASYRFKDGGYYTPAEAEAAGKKFVSKGNVYGSGAGNYGGTTQYSVGGGYEIGSSPQYSAENVAAFENSFGASADYTKYLKDQGLWQDPNPYGGFKIDQPNDFAEESMENYDFDYAKDDSKLKNALSTAGTYAPVGYNFARSLQKKDYFTGAENAEKQNVLDLMSNRRYDARPEIDESRRTFDQFEKVARDASGGNPSLYLAMMQGANVRANRAKTEALARENNMNNQYAAQEATMRGQLGREDQARLDQDLMGRLKTDANRRQFAAKGFEQTGQKSQVDKLMGGQKKTDETLANVLYEMYGDYDKVDAVLKKIKEDN